MRRDDALLTVAEATGVLAEADSWRWRDVVREYWRDVVVVSAGCVVVVAAMVLAAMLV